LGQKTGEPSMTVAQFLYQRDRYDLTMDDLYGVLLALDLAMPPEASNHEADLAALVQ
jgi:hypothetical protein